MKTITQINEEHINNTIIKSCSVNHFKLLECFHPSGKPVPNTNHIHKGFYNQESQKNRESFILNEKIHGVQYGLTKYKGGIIVFSLDVNAEKLSDNKIINKLKQFILTLKQRYSKNTIIDKIIRQFNGDETKLVDEKIYAYSVGNMFKGRYLSDNGQTFDEKSISVEVNGVSSSGILLLAEFLTKSFHQETVLVKDFNSDKIYLADSEKFTGSLEDLEKELKKVNVTC
ncbi:MAG: hypothetical protein NC548_40540 [Lachnospiraceae bacterium]|nr:hypothetical protein [Lachnospiraceae bacterium]